MMIAPARKKKIHDVLKAVYFHGPDDRVEVSDGDAGDLYLRVVSRKFEGMRMRQKHDLVWSILTKELTPDEWGQISMTVAASPEN